MSTVSVKNIDKVYQGKTHVLKDLSLAIESGEFLVLLGPSGCGKTTLLNCIAGLLDIEGGRIEIAGKDVTNKDPSDREIAMVFQSYALYPTKTVYGNMAFCLRMKKKPKSFIDKKVQETAELLQISELLHRKPATLSGGQRQRAAIGRALVRDAAVCLFDEPLSNLDAKLRTEMRIELKKLHNKLKSTFIYVTHDQVEAMTLATRIAVMDGGEFSQISTPDELYEHPANMFVARFIGSPAMNFVAGTLRLDGAKSILVSQEELEFDVSHYPFVVKPSNGQKVVLGLRPESFHRPTGRGATYQLTNGILEPLGATVLYYCQLGGTDVVVSFNPSDLQGVKTDQALEVSIDLDALSIFDAATELRL